jgi:hypothetical protein
VNVDKVRIRDLAELAPCGLDRGRRADRRVCDRVLATRAGVSGAVLLLPFQVSVLGTPSPAVTPTNLLYNVVATPGALYRYWRQGQTGGRLALMLIAGTLPGVIAGSGRRPGTAAEPRTCLTSW